MAVFNLTPAHVAVDRRRARPPLRGRGADARLQPGLSPPGRGASSCCARNGEALLRRRSTSRRHGDRRAQRARSSTAQKDPSPRRRSAAATSGSSCRSTASCTRSTSRATELSLRRAWPLLRRRRSPRLVAHRRRPARSRCTRPPGGSTCSCTRAGPTRTRSPGTEVWVYDLATRKRVLRIADAEPAGELRRRRSAAIGTGRMPGASCAGSSRGSHAQPRRRRASW